VEEEEGRKEGGKEEEEVSEENLTTTTLTVRKNPTQKLLCAHATNTAIHRARVVHACRAQSFRAIELSLAGGEEGNICSLNMPKTISETPR